MDRSHSRSTSQSKWKDVLGFDDGSPPNAATTYRYTPFAATSTDLTFSQQDAYPSFPRAINIAYHPNFSRKDLVLKPFLPTPKYGPEDKEGSDWVPKMAELFYVTVREDLVSSFSGRKLREGSEIQTSRPELLLHEGGRASNRVLAMAKFHSVTMCTDITLCPKVNIRATSVRAESHGGRPMTSPDESEFEKPKLVLGKDDGVGGRPRLRIVRVWLRGDNGFMRRGRWGFEIVREVRECYEWKRDKSREKAKSGDGAWCGLDVNWGHGAHGQSESLKLVNSRTKEMVAGFVRGDESKGSLGVFRFFGDEIGGEFDVMAVMSLLSVVERGRRKGSNRLSKAFRTE